MCKHYNVLLIEIAEESLGSTYKGKATGTFGYICIPSFFGNKIVTTSGGGMVISDDKQKIEKCVLMSLKLVIKQDIIRL